MLSRGPAQHDDYVTVNCTSASSASECFPLCSVANCSAFIPPPPPPPQPGPIRDRHVPVRLLLTVSLLSAFLFLSLALATLLLLYRRRRLLRRRRLRAAAPFPPNEGFGDDPEAGGGGVVHHVWYIRTVGLDEATIASIAVAEYRGGLGGGGDCAVCLGEFSDGDLVRLLPRCAHAFHVPCIDTWLRDHVNCPLCRSLVAAPSDPSAASSEAESEGAEPDAHQTLDETSQSDSQAEGSEFSSDTHSEEAATTAEDDARALPKPIRRSASMDSPLFLVVVPPVQDDAVEGNRKVRFFRGKEREGCGAAGSSSSGQVGRFGIGRSMSSSGQGFFFSRNGRSRSLVLPL